MGLCIYKELDAPAIVQLNFSTFSTKTPKPFLTPFIPAVLLCWYCLSLWLSLLLLLWVTSTSRSNPHVCSPWRELFLSHCYQTGYLACQIFEVTALKDSGLLSGLLPHPAKTSYNWAKIVWTGIMGQRGLLDHIHPAVRNPLPPPYPHSVWEKTWPAENFYYGMNMRKSSSCWSWWQLLKACFETKSKRITFLMWRQKARSHQTDGNIP